MLAPISMRNVFVDDAFWSPRIKTNIEQTIPHIYRMLKKSGRLDAFKLNWKQGQSPRPHHFWDSDVFKWLEAACYCLIAQNDDELRKLVNQTAKLIASAQQDDGYLNTYFTVVEPHKRWKNLRKMHELYNAGHFIEAAVAHFESTADTLLLDAACRYADYIDSIFGDGKGKRRGCDGHEEIELALIKLYRMTGNARYLELSRYFLDERGRRPHYFAIEAKGDGENPDLWPAAAYEHYQAHQPVEEQTKAVGHCVRAMYLYIAMADVAAETMNRRLLGACRRIWRNVTEKRMYITGGVGFRRQGESFGADYELPDETAYCETCAAIGLVFFSHRMLQLEADSAYADVMERTLYNAVLGGVSLDGKKFFYANPLAVYPEKYAGVALCGDHLTPHRAEWFECACCPPNIARLIASLNRYIYSTRKNALYVHLYIAGQTEFTVTGQQVRLIQKTNYPYDGKIRFTIEVDNPTQLALMLRIPRWCQKYTLSVNGKSYPARRIKGYLQIDRRFIEGDMIELDLAMSINIVEAHPFVTEMTSKVALTRGPLVYCLEQCDHKADLRCIRLPKPTRFKAKIDKNIAGGVVVLEGTGRVVSLSLWKNRLYQSQAVRDKLKTIKIKAVPYCLWSNRKAGAMTVWLRLLPMISILPELTPSP